jgi:hypothetical protein
VASLIRNSEAAPAVVQLVLFPLVFISGSYMPIHSDVLNRISGALPVRPFNLALMGPFAQHSGFDWRNLGVLLAWGAVGALIAVGALPLGPPTRMITATRRAVRSGNTKEKIMHPIIMRRLVVDHIRKFHAEAENERLARQARRARQEGRGIA